MTRNDEAHARMPMLACAGCGAEVAAIGAAGAVARCPHAGEGDVDHVLRPTPDAGGLAWPSPASSANPFVRYRSLLTSCRAAQAFGMPDEEFVALVERLDARIADVDGAGFRETPLRIERALATHVGLPCGNLLVKVEAGHVSGSHKARHLMGIMLMLEVETWARARGLIAGTASPAHRLAIASCGNAALAAAVVARAARRDLDVFVPTWAGGAVVDRLRELGATITACVRTPGVAGDPCYRGFKRAVTDGAMAFCCQGPDNGLTIEGGETLAWEAIDALDGPALDAMFVQVGGGALASAVMRGFVDAQRAGRLTRLPRLHAVQTFGCAPLVRAYDAVVCRILDAVGAGAPALATLSPSSVGERIRRSRTVAEHATGDALSEAVHDAATHRSAFMRPWDAEPQSIATGILDDETYDWLAIVEGMLRTGGFPVLASEETLAVANRLAHDTTDVDVCVTATAGLAGLIDAIPHDARLANDRVAVVFSGHRR